MKSITTKPTTDELLQRIIAALKKNGVRCGTGDQMNQIRAASK